MARGLIAHLASQNLGGGARLRAEAWLARTFLQALIAPNRGNIILATSGYEAVAVWRTRGALCSCGPGGSLCFCHVCSGAGSENVDVGSLLLLGAWQYMFRLSGWERRGRLPGFSSVLTANRHRLMHPHGKSFFHLLSATVRPGVDDAAVYLAAVVQPLCQLVRTVVGLCTPVLY